jgi:uncharacterized protein YeaO (DUF488 family)
MPVASRSRHRTTRESHGGSFSSPACYLHEFESASGDGATGAHGVAIKRIYEDPHPADGYRVLVDRLWPRGITKQRAALDAWLLELAPSGALRTWFGHDPKRWAEFRRRYRAELRAQSAKLTQLRQLAAQRRVTLLYGSREPRINHAVVLREVLLGARGPRGRSAKS